MPLLVNSLAVTRPTGRLDAVDCINLPDSFYHQTGEIAMHQDAYHGIGCGSLDTDTRGSGTG